MGLDRSKLSMRYARTTINVRLTVKMIEMSSTAQTRVMDVTVAIRCFKTETFQFYFLTFYTSTTASDAIQLPLNQVTI